MAKKQKTTSKNKGGRPKIPLIEMKDLPQKVIIFDQVLYWINLQATAEEIAGSFYVSVDTLDLRLKEHCGYGFTELYKRTEGGGKLSLRKFQFDLAKKNATMAIWLGKIWLKQSDKDEVREIVADVVRDVIREINGNAGIQAAGRSQLANEQSLFDKGSGREKDKVPDELGAERSMGRSSSMQDSPESKTARHNDVFLPPLT